MQYLDCIQALPVDDIVAASSKEPTVKFNWSPVVDNYFLLNAPTDEYMATPGLIDRFNVMVGCTGGEVAMGAAGIRNKNAFELIMKPLLGMIITN